MALAASVYNALFKRNSVFVTSVFLGGFAFSIGFDTVATKLWDNHNKGKQWKDIRHKYVQESESE